MEDSAIALVDNAWYVNFGNGSSTGYYAVPMWTASTAYAAGNIIRQRTTPSLNNERVFICIVAGTSLVSEPSFTLTRGAKTVEASGPTWQECSGIAALNGDATNTPSWTISATPPGGVKNTSVTLGQVIKRDNGASYQICTTAGTAGNGSEPAFSDTAGVTTTDNTVTWTSLGAVGNFTGWQAPHARLASAFATNWGGSGDSFFVASEHAETSSSVTTLTTPGSLAAPCFIYSVNQANIPPTSANLTAGASILTSGSAAISLGGINQFYYGITFSSAANINAINTSSSYTKFKDCSFTMNSTGSATMSLTTSGTVGSKVVYEACTFTFGSSVNLGFSSTGGGTHCIIKGGSVAFGANLPTLLFKASARPALLEIEGLDLSAFSGAGKTLIGDVNGAVITIIKNCKLGSTITKSQTITSPGVANLFINSDSGATNYLSTKYEYFGSQDVETTIVRTGGASDGVTAIAWKITTTANSKWVCPFTSIPIAIWNNVTAGTVTVTIYGIWDGGAVPNNDDIWMEVSYMGSSATPIATIVTTTKADNLASSSALTSDSSTWGGSTTKFKIVATLSSPQPQLKGPIYVTIKAALASSTFYIDPKPVLS